MVSLVVVVAAATIVVVVQRKHATKSQVALPPSTSQLGLPEQRLLTSSMRREPVPGWRISSSELGFPAGTVPKLIGNVGDRGFFLGITGRGWWLVGIDVATGRRSFAPVELGASENALTFNCFVNGPTMVICVRQDRNPNQPARAWVVDTEKGTLIFDGATDLRIPPTDNHPELEQVGDYVVATVTGEGVYGVGPHGELTWLVPGSGHLTQATEWDRDVAPQPLAVQDGAGSSTTSVVFSVADGKVVKPELPQGQRFGRAIAFPGGFGYEYSATGGYPSGGVAFFDVSGKPLGHPELVGTLRIGSLDLPMVETESTDVVTTLAGRKVLEIPKSTLAPSARLIRTRLLITADESKAHWQQYDLTTGVSGKTCEIEDLGFSYIGSDGAVAIVVGRRTPAEGYDLTTCDKLWSIPGSTQSEAKDVWKVNTTLVQRTNDELFSLVAPR